MPIGRKKGDDSDSEDEAGKKKPGGDEGEQGGGGSGAAPARITIGAVLWLLSTTQYWLDDAHASLETPTRRHGFVARVWKTCLLSFLRISGERESHSYSLPGRIPGK